MTSAHAGPRRGPRIRRRTIRRWTLPAVAWAALLFSMAAAVRRGAEARQLSREVESLYQREQMAREAVGTRLHRVDSLSSRARIRTAAAAIGLRPAADDEITFVPEGRE
ncbi:MAG: hypothetical protein ACE5HQ_12405 [Gemmatimonadota bacterium]